MPDSPDALALDVATYVEPDTREIEDRSPPNLTIEAGTKALNGILHAAYQAETDLAVLKADYQTWMERLKAVYQERKEGLEAHLAYLQAQGEAWLDAVPDLRGSRKSVKLMNGTVGKRKAKDKLVMVDPDAALAFAKAEAQAAVKTTESVLVSVLFDYFRATGDVPAGTVFEPGTEETYLKPTRPPWLVEKPADLTPPSTADMLLEGSDG